MDYDVLCCIVSSSVLVATYWCGAQVNQTSEFVDVIRALPGFVDLLFDDLQISRSINPKDHPVTAFIPILGVINQQAGESPWYPELDALHQDFMDRRLIPVVILIYSSTNVGAVLVAEIVEANLLREIAKSFPFLARQPRGVETGPLWTQYQYLLNTITTFYPLVFRAFHPWLKRGNPKELCDEANPIFPDWNSLHGMLAYKLLKRPVCANLTCPSNPIQVNLAKQCGGCFAERYCSRDCQKAHWKNGHREQCRPPSESFVVRDFVSVVMADRFTFMLRSYDFLTEEINPARAEATQESDKVAKDMIRRGGGAILCLLIDLAGRQSPLRIWAKYVNDNGEEGLDYLI
ncbi:hypothetical protein C8J56DRAFT_889249 [Mycena floridula]|nr:hypothetical protein C8J56DRAFT_889249 [Mycena floridula]